MEFACKSFCAWIIDVHQRIVTQLLGGILTRYSTVKFWLGTDNDFIYLRFYYLGIYKGIFKQTERVYFKHKPFRKYLLFVFYFFRSAFRMPTSRSYPRHLVQFREKKKKAFYLLAMSQGFPRVTKGYHGLLSVTKGCQRLPIVTRGYHRLPQVTMGYHGLP